MPRPGQESVTVENMVLYYIKPKSILIGPPGALEKEKHWIPRSELRDQDFGDLSCPDVVGAEGAIEIPGWLADDRGLS